MAGAPRIQAGCGARPFARRRRASARTSRRDPPAPVLANLAPPSRLGPAATSTSSWEALAGSVVHRVPVDDDASSWLAAAARWGGAELSAPLSVRAAVLSVRLVLALATGGPAC